MKQVIFIGGTSYSGSTFLDMVLANDPAGLSCGEINALFYPYRRHHVRYECGCGDPGCRIWEQVKSKGISEIYQTIFDLFPAVNYIVDSSKDPLWIADRTSDLADTVIKSSNILVWKSPDEFLSSRTKRGRYYGWRKAWLNYHKLYFRMVDDWRSIKYYELAKSPESIKKICKHFGIGYKEGRENYWKKTHHTRFGNTSAKIYLYKDNTEKYNECKKELSETIEESRKKGVEIDPESKRIFGEIIDILRARDILLSSKQIDHVKISAKIEALRASKVFIKFHRVKRYFRSLVTRFI